MSVPRINTRYFFYRIPCFVHPGAYLRVPEPVRVMDTVNNRQQLLPVEKLDAGFRIMQREVYKCSHEHVVASARKNPRDGMQTEARHPFADCCIEAFTDCMIKGIQVNRIYFEVYIYNRRYPPRQP